MFTYSGDPRSSEKDACRFMIGDTDVRDPLLQDGEIEYLLDLYNRAPLNAGIRACEMIAAKFSRMCDEAVGQVRITFSQKHKQYVEMRDTLTERLSKEDMTPYAGGITQSDKEAVAQDTNRVRPDFTKHMMEDNQIAPWTTQADISNNNPEQD